MKIIVGAEAAFRKSTVVDETPLDFLNRLRAARHSAGRLTMIWLYDCGLLPPLLAPCPRATYLRRFRPLFRSFVDCPSSFVSFISIEDCNIPLWKSDRYADKNSHVAFEKRVDNVVRGHNSFDEKQIRGSKLIASKWVNSKLMTIRMWSNENSAMQTISYG